MAFLALPGRIVLLTAKPAPADLAHQLHPRRVDTPTTIIGHHAVIITDFARRVSPTLYVLLRSVDVFFLNVSGEKLGCLPYERRENKFYVNNPYIYYTFTYISYIHFTKSMEA